VISSGIVPRYQHEHRAMLFARLSELASCQVI
jgi:hypothetical protein